MSDNLSHIPNNWIWTKIESLGDVITGKTPKKSVDEYYGNDVPFFKPKDLNNGFYVKESEDNLSELGANNVRILPPKSILVTCIGATIGKTGFSRVTGATNQQINSIIPSEFISPEYVFYLLSSPDVQKEIKEKASATTLPILNKTKFQKLDIPLPPLNEQKRIVTKIEELFTHLDAGVEELHKKKQQLKVYRQALLKHAFEGKLTQEWRETHKDELEPASVLLGRIKEERRQKLGKKYKELPLNTSKLPNIPDCWVWTRVGDVYDIVGGGTPSTKIEDFWDGNVPWITSADIYGINNIIPRRKVSEEGIKNSSTKEVPKNSLLVVTRVGLGKLAISSTNICFNQDIQALLGNNSLLFPNYSLYYLLQAVQIFKYKHRGTTISGVTKKQLSDLELALPPFKEQKRIFEELERSFSNMSNITKTISQSVSQARQLRHSILKKAFQGQLVPQDPNDEPATVLLERIKAEKERQKPKRSRKTRKKKAKSKQEVLV